MRRSRPTPRDAFTRMVPPARTRRENASCASTVDGWTEQPDDPASVYICCDAELVAGHPANRRFASTRSGVRAAIRQLVKTEANQVSELFVYFAGHGLGYKESPQRRGLDLLLTTDYVNAAESGEACINILELQENLDRWLLGDAHYYFLDACRTALRVGEILPAGLGLALDQASGNRPIIYTLYSTKFGETAPTNPKFPKALLGGLRGEGRAKIRVAKSWWVQFERLVSYVESHVDTAVDSLSLGHGEGLIAKLEGPFVTPLAVKVDGATPDTELELKIESNGIEQPFPFKGPAFEKALAPNDGGYGVDLLFRGKPLRRISPADDDSLDLYEPVELRYEMPTAGATRGGLESISAVRPSGALLGLRGADSPNVSIKVFDAEGKNILSGSRDISESGVAPGNYRVEVTENGRRIHEQRISLRRGVRTEADYFENTSRVRQSIASHVPNRDDGRVVDFSETLGPMAQQNTALWLSVLGASRLIDDPGVFSKLRDLPLANFDDLKKDDCAVYALAGLEHAGRAQLSISRTAKPEWQPMEPVAGLEGVHHHRVKVESGSILISFALPDRPPVTFASFALPNRAVLFVVTEDEAGKVDIRQMLLPVHSLQAYLPDVVTRRAKDESLRLVRYLLLQQDRFARRESLVPPEGQERRDLDEMLYGKWLDPLFALTAIYELARRGDKEKVNVGEAVSNLERYFGELPDVAAVTRIFNPKQRGKAPSGAPLLRESLLRMPKLLEQLPLPAGLLDYGSIWTSWVGAVAGPVWKKE